MLVDCTKFPDSPKSFFGASRLSPRKLLLCGEMQTVYVSNSRANKPRLCEICQKSVPWMPEVAKVVKATISISSMPLRLAMVMVLGSIRLVHSHFSPRHTRTPASVRALVQSRGSRRVSILLVSGFPFLWSGPRRQPTAFPYFLSLAASHDVPCLARPCPGFPKTGVARRQHRIISVVFITLRTRTSKINPQARSFGSEVETVFFTCDRWHGDPETKAFRLGVQPRATFGS